MSQQLQDKVALITGGASGIGAATAHAFAEAGAKVMVCDRQEEAGRVVVDSLAGDHRFVAADLRSREQAEAAVAATLDAFGRLDIVFNNAGVGLNALLADHSIEQIDDILAINLRAAILVSRVAVPHLLGNEDGGVIINNASNGGVIGRASDPVYCATKHGLVGFTKSLALAHAHEGIRVNAVCPGPIDTPMIWGLFEGMERDEALHRMLATCPDPRPADPGEVAATVVFLASDAARFINGVALPIDGAKAAGTMPAHRYRLDYELREGVS